MSLTSLRPLKDKLNIPLPSESEMTVAKAFVLRSLNASNDRSVKSSDILNLIREKRDAFPEVYRLLATIATFACSTAVCESSFSTLARIDRPQRQSQTHNRQRNLVLLGFEKKRTSEVDLDKFLEIFREEHIRFEIY